MSQGHSNPASMGQEAPASHAVLAYVFSLALAALALFLGAKFHMKVVPVLISVFNAGFVVVWAMGLIRDSRGMKFAILFSFACVVFFFLGTFMDVFINPDIFRKGF